MSSDHYKNEYHLGKNLERQQVGVIEEALLQHREHFMLDVFVIPGAVTFDSEL